MEHNIPTYDKAYSILRNESLPIERRRVAVIQPTGTGKSYILMQLLKDYGERTKIVIAPSKEFLKELQRNKFWTNTNTFIITYSSLYRNSTKLKEYLNLKGIDENKVELIALDEMHRAGAYKWSTAIKRLINTCSNATILGLTATPKEEIWHTENAVKEIFDNVTVGNTSLCDAINSGIISKLNYIAGIKSIDTNFITYSKYEYVRKIKEKIVSDFVGNKNNNPVECTLKKYIKTNNDSKCIKSIVFTDRIAKLDSLAEEFKGIFERIYRNKKVIVYTSEKNYSINKFLCGDSDNTVYIMIAVNKLNESYHIENISSIIMLRETYSKILYLQQIGRIISANNSNKEDENCGMFVFDFVSNIDNIGTKAFILGGSEQNDVKGIFSRYENDAKQYECDILRIRNELEKVDSESFEMFSSLIEKYRTVYDLVETDENRDLIKFGIDKIACELKSIGEYSYKGAFNKSTYLTLFIMKNELLEWYNQLKEWKNTKEGIKKGTLSYEEIKKARWFGNLTEKMRLEGMYNYYMDEILNYYGYDINILNNKDKLEKVVSKMLKDGENECLLTNILKYSKEVSEFICQLSKTKEYSNTDIMKAVRLIYMGKRKMNLNRSIGTKFKDSVYYGYIDCVNKSLERAIEDNGIKYLVDDTIAISDTERANFLNFAINSSKNYTKTGIHIFDMDDKQIYLFNSIAKYMIGLDPKTRIMSLPDELDDIKVVAFKNGYNSVSTIICALSRYTGAKEQMASLEKYYKIFKQGNINKEDVLNHMITRTEKLVLCMNKLILSDDISDQFNKFKCSYYDIEGEIMCKYEQCAMKKECIA